MTPNRRGTAWIGWASVVVLVVPFAGLVLQATADRWHGRAVLPQELGWRGFGQLWGDPVVRHAITNSLAVAFVVAVGAVVLAWPAARFLASSRSPLGWVLMATPVLIPPLALGEGLSTWFVRSGVGDGRVAMVIAHLAVAIPYATLGLVPGFDDELVELDHSAALLGASPMTRLRSVVVPAAKRHVALALALAFTVSWSQYGTSLAVGRGEPTLPLVLVPFVRSDPQIAAALGLAFLLPPVMVLTAAVRTGADRGSSGREPPDRWAAA